jgi:hypothetical protein
VTLKRYNCLTWQFGMEQRRCIFGAYLVGFWRLATPRRMYSLYALRSLSSHSLRRYSVRFFARDHLGHGLRCLTCKSLLHDRRASPLRTGRSKDEIATLPNLEPPTSQVSRKTSMTAARSSHALAHWWTRCKGVTAHRGNYAEHSRLRGLWTPQSPNRRQTISGSISIR